MPSQAALDGATGALGTVAIASLLLPGISDMWQAHPADQEQAKQLRTGEAVYFLVLGTAGVLYSAKARSIFPLLVVALIGGVVALTFERAFRHGGGGDDGA